MDVYTENIKSNSYVFTIRDIGNTDKWSNKSRECSNTHPINWVQFKDHKDADLIVKLLREHKPKIILVDIWENGNETGMEQTINTLVKAKGDNTIIFPIITKMVTG